MSRELCAVSRFVMAVSVALLASCSSTYMSGNALVVPETTREPMDLTLTITSGMSSRITGMQVDTVGDDTVVTRLASGTARRFVLQGLTGYRGKLRLDSVDLVVGGVSVWIDEHRFKAYGAHRSVDVSLHDEEGDDAFDGRDLVYAHGQLRAIGGE